jgi:hypothetical protein
MTDPGGLAPLQDQAGSRCHSGAGPGWPRALQAVMQDQASVPAARAPEPGDLLQRLDSSPQG